MGRSVAPAAAPPFEPARPLVDCLGCLAMGFKSILVHAEDSEAGQARLQTAIALTRRYDAHLTALCIGIEPSMAAMGFAHASPAVGVFMQDVEAARQRAEELGQAVKRRIESEGVLGEVRAVSASVDALAGLCTRQALYHDLALVGQAAQDGSERIGEQVLEGTLFGTATPTIVHPNGRVAPPGSRIMVGWDGRREAAAAINRAMPFLEEAASVELVLVDPQVGANAHGEEPGADMALMLARRDIEVTVNRLPKSGLSIGQVFEDRARDWAADLIVMGAYGHSRLREFVLGGTTREMLRSASVPLLLAQ